MGRVLCVTSLMFAVSALICSGCGSKQKSDQPATSMPGNSDIVDTLKADIERELAKLSQGDRELALTQKICLVSGEPLGSMGLPIKVTVKGREAFVCCEGCVDELKNNFAKHEDKLP